jgi:hypothetical protein
MATVRGRLARYYINFDKTSQLKITNKYLLFSFFCSFSQAPKYQKIRQKSGFSIIKTKQKSLISDRAR